MCSSSRPTNGGASACPPWTIRSCGHPISTRLARDGVLFANHFANAVPCGPSRTSLHTGMYLQNHRSGTNGTPLDARHTNWAKAAAAIGYDPVLFGYTDTSLDPRELEADDPWLRTYEGPLPGIRPLVLMGETPYPWIEWLKAKGHDVPEPIGRRPIRTARTVPTTKTCASVPKPLAYPAEDDDTNFLGRSLYRLHAGRQGPVHRASVDLKAAPAHRGARAVQRDVRSGRGCPASRALATPEAEAAQHPWLAYQLSRRQFRAGADDRKLRRMKAVYYG